MVSYKRKNNQHRRAVRKRNRKAEFRRHSGRQGRHHRYETGGEGLYRKMKAKCTIM